MDQNNKYASFGRRLMASLLDSIIITPIYLLTIFIGRNLLQIRIDKPNYLLNFIISGLYIVIFWASFGGATIGKKVFGIKIVKVDDQPINYPRSILRWLCYLISSLPLFLGFFWMLWDPKKQTWHDKIAGTKVVRTDDKPRVIQAIIVFIIIIFFYAAAFFIGFYSALTKATGTKSFSASIKKITSSLKNEMNPEAKVHFDRYKTLLNRAKTIYNNQYLPILERERRIKPVADEFIGELISATQLDPKNPAIWSEFGHAYSWPNTKGTTEDSLNSFKKALELDPENTVYMNYVGDTLIKLGRYNEALAMFKKSLSLFEASGYANLSIGIVYKQLGNYEKARTHIQRAIDIFVKENGKRNYDNEIIEARKELI